MEHEIFYILSSLYMLIYFSVLIFLYIRSKSPPILRRSPVLLYFSIIGGLLQNIIILSQIVYPSSTIIEHYSNSTQILQLRQISILLGHILLLMPYLLRGYRLYFIFHLDKNWFQQDDYFKKNVHRTQQRWLLKVLFLSLIPWALMTIDIILQPKGNFMPGSELKYSKTQLNFSECFYVLMCFIEQMSLISSLYLLRNVFDDYKMTRELVWACLFWVITPMFPFFDANPLYRIPTIIRNTFLLCRSCIVPLISSYKSTSNIEVITQEMINSCELILQSPIGLHYFEKFLKNFDGNQKEKPKISGIFVLEMFMLCEQFLCSPSDKQLLDTVCEVLKSNKISNYQENSEGFVQSVRENLFSMLKNDFFSMFLKSNEYSKLKRVVTNQEIFIGRILQTSLQCNSYSDTIFKRKASSQQMVAINSSN